MGSQFVKTKDSRRRGRGPFASSQRSEIFLQFVPGQVTDVATNPQSKAWQAEPDQNSILAKSHIKENETVWRLFGSDKRYTPLLRGQVDVPVIGDPVLLCTFGGVRYYLGPLNTQNSPNHNLDPFGINQSTPLINGKIVGSKAQQKDSNGNIIEGFIDTTGKFIKQTMKELWGESPNFVKSSFKRLEKPYIEELDNPRGTKKGIKDIHGDMIFEGRHGNSIRLGSRDQHPNIIISNGRSRFNSIESMNDGSLLAMLYKGSILTHFQFDAEIDETASEDMSIVDKPFVLASDSKPEVKRFIGDALFNYQYDGPQTIMSSDKIVLNSKGQGGLILSSLNNTIIGSGTDIQIISDNSTIIESENIFLGKQAKKKRDDGEQVESLVLGIKLKDFLIELIDTLKEAKCTCQSAPLPLVDSKMKPMITKFEGLIRKLKKPEFLSDYHFIEDNEQKQ